MKTASIFLITVALIAGMVGCGGIVKYDLTVSSTEGGSVTTPGESTFTYEQGKVVELVAAADEGYQFVEWTGDVDTITDAEDAGTTITMNDNYSIIANFAIEIIEIRDWYDLHAIRENLSGSYLLMNNIDSTSTGYEELAGPAANRGHGWEPIGSLCVDPSRVDNVDPVNPFAGNFDGQGYEIRDLFISRPDEDGVGLLGCLGSRGVVQDVGMVNAEVTGHLYVGGLVGENHYGTVSNSYSTGNVTGDEYVGGLVGGNWHTVSNSYSTGSVAGDVCVGGLEGGNWGDVVNSYSTSSVAGGLSVGGLVGSNWGTASNSYSTGGVTGGQNVGGLAGWQHGGTVSSCYSMGNVTGTEVVGGLVGESHNGIVSNSYYSYDEVLINGRNIITIGALFNEDFQRWLADDKSLDVDERLSQEDGYYLINDINDFKNLLAFGQDGALKFRLKSDLDLGNEPDFYIPYLAGEFDGNSHKIANVSFSFDCISQVGLFGYLAPGGAVAGVSAENVNITGNGIVGGLVGENAGIVSDSYSTGGVAGYWCVGGLVGCIGWNGGTVSNSYYKYDEVLINGRSIITIGALFNEDFKRWLADDKSLDVDERLSQEDGYYLINDINDFKNLLAFGQDGALKFRLKSDLDLGDDPNFYIPYLAATFDGGGHRISNLRLNFDSVAHVGLFGYLAYGGEVTQLGSENIQTIVEGCQQNGGLVGDNAGTVSNAYSTGSVTGSGDVGGLVGWNQGIVSNAYSTSSVTGTGDTGGLVGWNYDGTVSNSYSIGTVTGGNNIGGLVGVGDTVSQSFWDIETSKQSTSVGGTGKTTTEMKEVATYSTQWDITGVPNPSTRDLAYTWNIVDGETYPFLSWQL